MVLKRQFIFLMIFGSFLVVKSVLGVSRSDVGASMLEAAQQFQADSLMRYGIWSIYAMDTHTGETIIEYNAEKSLAPASCLKLVTSAVALCSLGTDHRFKTFLAYDGNLTGITLNGNLYIQGGGDPTLGSERIDTVTALPDLLDEWVQLLTQTGINRINGHIIGDDSYFDDVSIPDTWIWTDMGNYYGAGTSGLCIHENLYRLFFRTGQKEGDKTHLLRIEPRMYGLQLMNQVTSGPSGSGDNAYIYCAPRQWNGVIRGTLPPGKNAFSIKGSMPNPARVCARLLYEALKAAGITIKGQVYTNRDAPQPESIPLKRNIIWSQESPALSEIIYWLNKRSINLYAEQILKELGKQMRSAGRYEAGIEVIGSFFKTNQISTSGLDLQDGSGLSRFNRIRTYHLANLLERITQTTCFSAFYESFPIAGDNKDKGTARSFCRGTIAAKNARVKTGSINGVRSHAGYVTDCQGHLIAFAMIANMYEGSLRQVDQFHEKMVVALAKRK